MATVPLAVWLEWKEQCAAALCGDDTRRQLHSLAYSRCHGLARRYAHLVGSRDHLGLLSDLTPETAWHYLESYGAIRESRTGKRYKDWLVSRASGSAPPSADTIEAGVVLLLRDALRSRLRREHAPAGTRSLDAPLGPDGESLTLADLLSGGADPSDEATATEYRQLARVHARDIFDTMTPRERFAAVARALGLSFAASVVLRAAGCGKSTLSVAYRECIQSVGRQLQKMYASEGAEGLMSLTLMTVGALQAAAVVWGKSEKSCAALFKEVERGPGTGRRATRGLKEAGGV